MNRRAFLLAVAASAVTSQLPVTKLSWQEGGWQYLYDNPQLLDWGAAIRRLAPSGEHMITSMGVIPFIRQQEKLNQTTQQGDEIEP